MQALLSSSWNIGVLPTLFWSQIQKTAPYKLLWIKLTLSQPKPILIIFLMAFHKIPGSCFLCCYPTGLSELLVFVIISPVWHGLWRTTVQNILYTWLLCSLCCSNISIFLKGKLEWSLSHAQPFEPCHSASSSASAPCTCPFHSWTTCPEGCCQGQYQKPY